MRNGTPLFQVGEIKIVHAWRGTGKVSDNYTVIITGISTSRNCQSGVMYSIDPILPNMHPDDPWIDQGWFFPDHETPEV